MVPKCGGSEVRIILAASPRCGLLNQSHTRFNKLLVPFAARDFWSSGLTETNGAAPAQAPANGAFEEALSLERKGNAQAAEESYRAVLSQHPEHAGALHRLSLLCLNRGDFAEAARLLRRWIAREPNVSEAHNNLGIALNRLNRPAEAVAHFEKAVELEPNRAEAHYNLGRALQRIGRLLQ